MFDYDIALIALSNKKYLKKDNKS